MGIKSDYLFYYEFYPYGFILAFWTCSSASYMSLCLEEYSWGLSVFYDGLAGGFCGLVEKGNESLVKIEDVIGLLRLSVL